MPRRLQHVRSTTFARLSLIAAVTLGILVPQPASAQSSDSWKVTFAPMYLWASKLRGDITVRGATVPVSMSFKDAVDDLAAAFTVHFEAEKNRFGIFTDLSFVGLSTKSALTLQGPLALTIDGAVDVDNTFFEAGGSYLLSDKAKFAVIGGLRTFTVSTKVSATTSTVSLTPIDASRTAASGFAGFTYRPEISKKVRFFSRADIGGGSGMSWSGVVGLEFLPKPWAGLVVGYKAMGIQFGKDSDEETLRHVDLTYSGPAFGLNLHGGGR